MNYNSRGRLSWRPLSFRNVIASSATTGCFGIRTPFKAAQKNLNPIRHILIALRGLGAIRAPQLELPTSG